MLALGCEALATPLQPFAYFRLCCSRCSFRCPTPYVHDLTTPLEPFGHFYLDVLAYVGHSVLTFYYPFRCICWFSTMLFTMLVQVFNLISSWFYYPSLELFCNFHLPVLFWLMLTAGCWLCIIYLELFAYFHASCFRCWCMFPNCYFHDSIKKVMMSNPSADLIDDVDWTCRHLSKVLLMSWEGGWE